MTSSFRHRFDLLSFVILLLSTAGPTQGAIVTSCDENALRSAANGGGMVTFTCDGTIALSSTLVISNDLTLDGSGRSITISGSNAVRVLSVKSGVRLTIIHLTVANGRSVGTNGLANSDGEPAFGAAIYNDGGTVDLINCALTNNVARGGDGGRNSSSLPSGGAAGGGAVFNKAGALNVTNSWFERNLAAGGMGGGMGSGAFLTWGNGGHAFGGGIFNLNGTVSIVQSVFAANSATGGLSGAIGGTVFYSTSGSGFGGAVHSAGGSVSLESCNFFANRAFGAPLPWTGTAAGTGNGGAVGLSNAPATCVRCLFGTNTALGGTKVRYGTAGEGRGGAMFSDALLALRECSFNDNLATTGGAGVAGGDGKGGGVCALGTTHVSASTFFENQARGGNGAGVGSPQAPGSGGNGMGGAIYNIAALAITNSTLLGNIVRGGDGVWFGQGGAGNGGAVYNTNGIADLMNCTAFGNSAVGGKVGPTGAGPPGVGQGGALCCTNGSLTIRNVILANSPSGSNCFGAIVDGGHNISSDRSCNFSAPGSLSDTDPVLGPLGDYGGPTLTVPLLAGSPAIDGGDSMNCAATDQRGHARPFGSSCDVGAFESSPPFLIRGTVSRYLPGTGVAVSAGAQSGAVMQNGTYTITGLADDSYAVSVSTSNVVGVPPSRSVSVGPDRLNINFDSYPRNGLWIESSSNNAARVVYGGTNGQIQRVEITSDFQTWQPYSTNSVGSDNIFELYETNRVGAGFFRTFRLSP